MFDTLVASRDTTRPRSGATGLLSLTIHASLVVGVVWATPHVVRQAPTPLVPIELWPVPDNPSPTDPTPPLVPPGPVGGLVISVPDFVPDGLPPIDPYGPATPIVGAPGTPVVPGGPPGDGLYVPAAVDELPEVLAGPVPFYPERLRQAGIEGQVVVEVVVDTLGRAERGSIRVVTTPHQGFVEPAKDYVRGALFRPARVGGRAVRVLVRLPIAFKLQRR